MATKPEDSIIVEVSVGENKELTAKIGDNQADKITKFAAFMAGTPAPASATAIDASGAIDAPDGSSKGGKSKRNRKSKGRKSRKARKSLRRK